MQVVTDENNITHNFPDDATPDEMNAAIGIAAQPSLSQDIGNRLAQTALRSAKGEDTLPETVLGVGGSVALPLVNKAGEILNSFMPNYTPSGGTTFGSNRGVANPQPITADSPFSTSNVVSQVTAPITQNFPRLTRDIGNALAIEGLGAAGGLAKDVAGSAIKPMIAPAALPAATADLVKSAEAQGVTIPNAALLNTDSFAANHTNIKGYPDYKAAVNQNAADLIGANDVGATHSTVNEPALVDARKNNGAAIAKVDNGIGNVSMTPKLDAINQEVAGGYPSDNAFWKKFATDTNSVTNPDGTIHASDIRDLTGYNSDLAKKARSTANDAPQAKRVISHFKDAVNDSATPVQQAELFDVNNKYKLMSEFNDVGKTTGVGTQLEPTKIRDTLNRAYSNPNEVQYPARILQDTLNTFHPVSGVESPLQGLLNAEKSSTNGHGFSPVGLAEAGAATGHGLPAAALAATIKAGTWIPDFVTSKYTNSDFFRNQLLRNATPPKTPPSPKLLTYNPLPPSEKPTIYGNSYGQNIPLTPKDKVSIGNSAGTAAEQLPSKKAAASGANLPMYQEKVPVVPPAEVAAARQAGMSPSGYAAMRQQQLAGEEASKASIRREFEENHSWMQNQSLKEEDRQRHVNNVYDKLQAPGLERLSPQERNHATTQLINNEIDRQLTPPEKKTEIGEKMKAAMSPQEFFKKLNASAGGK